MSAPSSLLSAASSSIVKVWQPGNEQAVRTIDRFGVRSVAFNHTGRVLATAGTSGSVALYDTESSAALGDLPAPPTTMMQSINAIAFSKGSRLLAVGGSAREVQVWDLKTQKKARALEGHSHSITSVAFSANDAYVASTSTAGDVRLHLAASGTEAVALPPGDRSPKGNVCFLLESAQSLAAGGESGSIYVYDTFSASLTASLVGTHAGPVTGLLPLSDESGGSAVFSAGEDRALVLSDLRTRGAATRATVPVAVTCLAAREGTPQFAVGTSSGAILMYDFRDFSRPTASIGSLFSTAITDLKFQKAPPAAAPAKGAAQSVGRGGAMSDSPRREASTSAGVSPIRHPAPSHATAPAASKPPPAPAPAAARTLASTYPRGDAPPSTAAAAPAAAATTRSPQPPQPGPVPPTPAASSLPAPPREPERQAQPAKASSMAAASQGNGSFGEGSQGGPDGLSGSFQEGPAEGFLMQTVRGYGSLMALGRALDASMDATRAAADQEPAVAGRVRLDTLGPGSGLSALASPGGYRESDALMMGGGAAGGVMLETIEEGEGTMTDSSPARSMRPDAGSLGGSLQRPRAHAHTNGAPSLADSAAASARLRINSGAMAHAPPPAPPPAPSLGIDPAALAAMLRAEVRSAVEEAMRQVRGDIQALQVESIRQYVEVTEQLGQLQARQEAVLRALEVLGRARPSRR